MDPELLEPNANPTPIPPKPPNPKAEHILDLCDELLLKIVSYLGSVTEDHINLTQSCTRFDNLLQDASFCRRINVPWNINMERSNLVKYLLQPVRAGIMTELNLNDIYWIPSGEIKDLVLKLSNLEGLYACGTLLNEDLLEILVKLSLRDLSWTWKIGRAINKSNYDFFKSDELSEKLSQLRKLCLFIPPIFKTEEHLDLIPHLSICYFLSLCVGLEKLWLFSCDRAAEVEELEIFDRIYGARLERLNSAPEIEFPNLVDFVYSFPRDFVPKLCVPKLVSRILQGFTLTEVSQAGNEQEISPVPVPEPLKPKQLWIEHPYLSIHCKSANSLNFNRPGWPQMDLSNLESISFPIFRVVLNGLFPNDVLPLPDLSKCKHLQITDEEDWYDRVNLDGYFESAVNLESFLSKADNYELDWNAFVESHPKITLINVHPHQDKHLIYPDFFVALSKLAKLKRISVPHIAFKEIPDSEASVIQEFRILVSSLGTDLSHSTTRPTGLDFLTLGCRGVEEFEIWPARHPCDPISLNSLMSISLWTNLKKLTLSLVGISDGGFLIEIAKSCPLETIRLTIHDDEEDCLYMENLCQALRFCQHLKDFRWEEEHPGVIHTQVLPALQTCKNLERLVIKSKFGHINRLDVLELMKICTRLSVLYLFIPNTTKATCNFLRMELESMFKDSRPSLSIAIRNTYDYTPLLEFEYPAIHYRQMVVFSSQVDPNYDYPDKFV